MKSIADVFAVVEKNFADPVSSEKAFYGDQGRGGAIPGMLHTLDPHSNFVDPAEYREMQRRQHAQYYGVGMQITMDQMPTDKHAKVIVMEPFVNSPAWNAGMRRGDVIVGGGRQRHHRDGFPQGRRTAARAEGHPGQGQRDARGRNRSRTPRPSPAAASRPAW